MRDDGLTDSEGLVMDHLVSVYECYRAIGADELSHPDDLRKVVSAIHDIQDILACRIARRMFPNGWATINKPKGTK